MRILFLALLTTCNTYTGVLVSKDNFSATGDVKISDTHYVLPKMTIDQFDSIKIGDTLLIDRTTLRLLNYANNRK